MARILISTPRMVEELLIVGDSAVRLLVTPGERAPRGEKLPKRLPNSLGAAEAKAAALHPDWYQSSVSKLSTREGGRGGEKKRRQSDWLSGDRQTG